MSSVIAILLLGLLAGLSLATIVAVNAFSGLYGRLDGHCRLDVPVPRPAPGGAQEHLEAMEEVRNGPMLTDSMAITVITDTTNT
jgi:hypothetical protein